MQGMADNSVDAVISDPPYGAGIASWDMEIPPQEILTECLRVSKGPVVWFGGRSTTEMFAFGNYDPRPERLLFWHVTFSLSSTSSDNIYYRWHPIWCWRLPAKQDAIARDVLEYPVASSNGYDNHPAKKPVGLMIQLVEAFGGQNVLDPFMGSGTTGVACARLGVDFTGCDISAEYHAMATRRIREAQTQAPMVFPPFDQLPFTE
jgi:DNA modification methylase